MKIPEKREGSLLTVLLLPMESTRHNAKVWRCVCVCGNWTDVIATNIRRNTVSCGCFQRAAVSKVMTTHGRSRVGDTNYNRWHSIKGRCFNEKDGGYPNYGGRGISLHHTWIDSYERFAWYLDNVLGPRPDGFSLDRIDNDSGYEPRNLRWADKSTQRKNQRPRGRVCR